MVKWTAIFKRLMKIMDMPGDPYFSGPRFIRKIQEEVDPDFSDYYDFIEERKQQGQSTTRSQYFRDILMALDEASRAKVILSILSEVEKHDLQQASAIRQLMGGGTVAPTASIPLSAWSGERLNGFLAEIDSAVVAQDYERAVTLSYTCLEGFLGAFVRAKFPGQRSYPNEILALAKDVKQFMKTSGVSCPDELLKLVTQIPHAIDRARNQFSEAHFANQAAAWMAIFVRDLVNIEIRLLLHFM